MTTAAGKCFLDMLGVFAEFEANLRRERQAEGIARAKKAGVYRGRKPTIDATAIRQLHDSGMVPAAIAERLAVSPRTVYRTLATIA
jgi:DNA invertase Pin-like site-specific DNA recombinase